MQQRSGERVSVFMASTAWSQSGQVDADTQILDRDSYNLVLPPLSDSSSTSRVASELRGKWSRDAIDMLTLKVLPELQGANRLITTGTVSRDDSARPGFRGTSQERRNPNVLDRKRCGGAGQSSHGIRVIARGNAGYPPTALEILWFSVATRSCRR